MPLRPSRVGRVGVIRAPVAKTAVVAAAVTPGRASHLGSGCVGPRSGGMQEGELDREEVVDDVKCLLRGDLGLRISG
jgi:hypothetical protein